MVISSLQMNPDDIAPQSNDIDKEYTIRIGVTGHRKIPEEQLVQAGVKEALAIIYKHVPDRSPERDIVLTVISPLAEGADRIVASEVLRWYERGRKHGSLEAVLPMVQEEYVRDFATPGSVREFECLLSAASSITVIEDTGERTHNYEKAGRFVVDHCDILIAIWDGESSRGRGGTAEIVQYARDIKRSLIWINPLTGKIRESWL
jgi:hypothetical protein